MSIDLICVTQSLNTQTHNSRCIARPLSPVSLCCCDSVQSEVRDTEVNSCLRKIKVSKSTYMYLFIYKRFFYTIINGKVKKCFASINSQFYYFLYCLYKYFFLMFTWKNKCKLYDKNVSKCFFLNS